VGPRAGLDAEARGKILCLCRGSNPGRPVRSQSLSRSIITNICIIRNVYVVTKFRNSLVFKTMIKLKYIVAIYSSCHLHLRA
jgi:hypothetical protein